MIERFHGKKVLITGAGTGMGKAVALRLAQEGAQLVLIGRRANPIDELAVQINQSGGTALAISCDMSDESSLLDTMTKIHEHFGELHGLFANAGILGEFSPLVTTKKDTFAKQIETNLLGTFLTIQQSLPFMNGGAIVINASWTTQSVMPGAGAYAATKGALLSVMRTLAIEEGMRGIRVNAISPGIILTPMAAEALDDTLRDKLASHSALKRNGTPDDVSGTVAWLLSDDSAFVTGQDITIDGGYTIGGVRL